MRRLIVNADDFGKSVNVTEAIVTGHIKGIITSTSLMVTGAAVEQAVAYAQQCKSLSIGLHLNLTEGYPVTRDVSGMATLTNGKGQFLGSEKFRKRCYSFRIDWGELFLEVENQIRAFIAHLGRLPTHLDSHHHVHTVPHVG